jgi:hypothetical protein
VASEPRIRRITPRRRTPAESVQMFKQNLVLGEIKDVMNLESEVDFSMENNYGFRKSIEYDYLDLVIYFFNKCSITDEMLDENIKDCIDEDKTAIAVYLLKEKNVREKTKYLDLDESKHPEEITIEEYREQHIKLEEQSHALLEKSYKKREDQELEELIEKNKETIVEERKKKNDHMDLLLLKKDQEIIDYKDLIEQRKTKNKLLELIIQGDLTLLNANLDNLRANSILLYYGYKFGVKCGDIKTVRYFYENFNLNISETLEEDIQNCISNKYYKVSQYLLGIHIKEYGDPVDECLDESRDESYHNRCILNDRALQKMTIEGNAKIKSKLKEILSQELQFRKTQTTLSQNENVEQNKIEKNRQIRDLKYQFDQLINICDLGGINSLISDSNLEFNYDNALLKSIELQHMQLVTYFSLYSELSNTKINKLILNQINKENFTLAEGLLQHKMVAIETQINNQFEMKYNKLPANFKIRKNDICPISHAKLTNIDRILVCSKCANVFEKYACDE